MAGDPIIVGDVLEATLIAQYSGQPMLTVTHWRTDAVVGTPTVSQMVGQMPTMPLLLAMAGLQAEEVLYTEGLLQNLGDPDENPWPPKRSYPFAVPLAASGDVEGHGIPGNACGVVRKIGQSGSDAYILGRVFVGGIPEGQQIDGLWTPLVDERTALINALKTEWEPEAGGNSLVLRPIVLSMKHWKTGIGEKWEPTVSVVINTNIRTLKRRAVNTSRGGY